MKRIVLTDRFIASPARIPGAGRRDYFDAIVPGLILNVSHTGYRSFMLGARYPGSGNYTRRSIGQYGVITLDKARHTSREWLDLITKGIDPANETRKKAARDAATAKHVFGVMAEDYLRRYVKGPAYCELERLAGELAKADPAMKASRALRVVMDNPAHASLLAKSKEQGLVKKQAAESIIRSELISRWEGWPVQDVGTAEVAEMVQAIVERGAPETARSALEWLRGIYSWAKDIHAYGVKANPAADLKAAKLIGKKKKRDRILENWELKAIWDACGDGEGCMGHPYGPTIRMMLLTGQRETEVGGAPLKEFNLADKVWVIAPENMKGEHGRQLVPLAPQALALIRGLPQFVGSEYAFSTDGRRPVNGWSKAKARLDLLCGVKDWVFHDLRRTMRTHLSALPIEEHVRELMIAHKQGGIKEVYDLYKYEDEKRRGFELWEQRLARIVNPPPAAEVIELRTGT